MVPQHPPNIPVESAPPDVVEQAVGIPLPVAGPADAAAEARAKTKAPLELRRYDGTDSLETYLAKYELIASYQNWTETDRYSHLCASLEGAAGQVLWGLKPGATSEAVVNLLRTRFGNDMQMERYRAELRARKRKPEESLQALYLDITRMVSLAHPDAVPELTKHVAKEVFVAALNNEWLQMRVMEKLPQTIEEALGIAGRLEAYESTLTVQGPPRDQAKVEGQSKNKRVYTVDAEKSSTEQQLLDKMTELQRQFAEFKDQKQGNNQSKGHSRRKGRNRFQNGSRHNNCGEFGHRARECWQQPPWDPGPMQVQVPSRVGRIKAAHTVLVFGQSESRRPLVVIGEPELDSETEPAADAGLGEAQSQVDGQVETGPTLGIRTAVIKSSTSEPNLRHQSVSQSGFPSRHHLCCQTLHQSARPVVRCRQRNELQAK